MGDIFMKPIEGNTMDKIIFELCIHKVCEDPDDYLGLLRISRKTEDGDTSVCYDMEDFQRSVIELSSIIYEVLYTKTDIFGIKKALGMNKRIKKTPRKKGTQERVQCIK